MYRCDTSSTAEYANRSPAAPVSVGLYCTMLF